MITRIIGGPLKQRLLSLFPRSYGLLVSGWGLAIEFENVVWIEFGFHWLGSSLRVDHSQEDVGRCQPHVRLDPYLSCDLHYTLYLELYWDMSGFTKEGSSGKLTCGIPYGFRDGFLGCFLVPLVDHHRNCSRCRKHQLFFYHSYLKSNDRKFSSI